MHLVLEVIVHPKITCIKTTSENKHTESQRGKIDSTHTWQRLFAFTATSDHQRLGFFFFFYFLRQGSTRSHTYSTAEKGSEAVYDTLFFFMCMYGKTHSGGYTRKHSSFTCLLSLSIHPKQNYKHSHYLSECWCNLLPALSITDWF